MNIRQQFKALMNFQPAGALPAMEWISWWDKTLERWCGEGLPKLSREDTLRHFGLAVNEWVWISPRWTLPRPADRPRSAGYIDSEADYERVVAPTLRQAPVLDTANLRRIAAAQATGDVVVWMQIDGFFWFPREIFGVEPHLFAFYDQPALMHRINDDLCRWNNAVLDQVLAILAPDVLTFAEDLSYNHGPMLSREQFDEFIAPRYRRIVPRLKQAGVIPMVDTDGDVMPVVPWMQAAGIEGCLPLERMAGVDVAELRRLYPTWRMIGGFDKTVTHLGEAAITAECERLLPVMRSGGFLPSTDHQTPPGVSLADFHTYVRLLKHYCQLAGSTRH